MQNNTSLTPSRQAAAAALVEQHLANRAAQIITGRVCATGVTTFQVQGHQAEPYTVTVAGVGASMTTCSCKSFQARHTCRHTDAVALLTAPSQAAPGAEWEPVGGWTSSQRKSQGRQERVEEV